MIVKTRVFELSNGSYGNLSELARAMEISVSQVYRVREGTRNINQKFITGAIKAFPGRKLDDLFYLVSQLPSGNKNGHRSPAIYVVNRPGVRETSGEKTQGLQKNMVGT